MIARALCFLFGHNPRPLIPLRVQVAGGEGYRPFECIRCKQRIYEMCDDWHAHGIGCRSHNTGCDGDCDCGGRP